jgi:DNA polymerase I-like protein with 3'-5' exonuclease and polymerase domains
MSKAAAVMIAQYIERHNIDAWAVDIVHDELVYECRADQAEAFAVVVKTLMEKAGKFYLPDVPIKADFPKNSNGVVDCWTKEVKLAA